MKEEIDPVRNKPLPAAAAAPAAERISNGINWKLIASWIIIIGLLAGGFLFFRKNQNQEEINAPQIESAMSLFPIRINGKEISVEVASTDKKRMAGLSKYSGIPENQGMLFVFDSIGIFSIWMKDMQFPIDIIWIDKDYKIVDLTENVGPETYPKTFQPKAPVRFALEVNVEFIKKNNIEIGDTVSLGNIYVPPVKY